MTSRLVLDGLEERIRRLTADLRVLGSTRVTEAADAVARDIGEPLRIAVVGRVNAGKSTLVNALIGRRVAATDDSETTRIVTHYVQGSPERGMLVLTDGTTVDLPLDRGRAVEPLPVDAALVDHAVVVLPERALEGLALIDTPGVGTRTESNVTATRAGVIDAATRPDALLYVFQDLPLADDAAFLADFRAAAGSSAGSATVLGVLSRADQFGEGAWAARDPLEAAREHAAAIAAQRTGDFADVVPVAALLAESALTGRVTEDTAHALAELDGVDDATLRFGGGHDELRRLLGDYGVRFGRHPATQGASALIRWLRDTSGLDGVSSALEHLHIRRHRQLKAAAALRRLRASAQGAPVLMDVVRLISEAEVHPDLHPLRELAAWEAVRARQPGAAVAHELERQLAAEYDTDAVGAPADASDAEVADRALRLARAAREAAAVADDSAVRAAYQVLARGYGLIADRQAATRAV